MKKKNRASRKTAQVALTSFFFGSSSFHLVFSQVLLDRWTFLRPDFCPKDQADETQLQVKRART